MTADEFETPNRISCRKTRDHRADKSGMGCLHDRAADKSDGETGTFGDRTRDKTGQYRQHKTESEIARILEKLGDRAV